MSPGLRESSRDEENGLFLLVAEAEMHGEKAGHRQNMYSKLVHVGKNAGSAGKNEFPGGFPH